MTLSIRRWGIALQMLATGAMLASSGQARPNAGKKRAHYVALGSSFAAGPGVGASADLPPNRCARSSANYAHLLAERLSLKLTDVSCSGATTAHVLGPWADLAPQIDAVTPDTRLVTITIGGNDVSYVGALLSASCRSFPTPPPGAPGGKCPGPPIVSEQSWTELDTAMRRIALEIHHRAPKARLVFVDYLTVLPAAGSCPSTPLSPAEAEASRATARRLEALTTAVARDTKSKVLRASAMSRSHDACSADPWITGFPLPGGPGFLPFHPNARGMAAIADALAESLR